MLEGRTRITQICLVLLGVVMITGCRTQGSQYLGKWENTHNLKDTMEIDQNGEGYLIVADSKKIGAAYKDGSLQVQGAFGGLSLTYVKKSDTIVAPGFMGQVEYKRVN